jgi:hypothetical protein
LAPGLQPDVTSISLVIQFSSNPSSSANIYGSNSRLRFSAGRFIEVTALEEIGSNSNATTDKCPLANLPTTKSGQWGEGVTGEEMADYVWLRPEIEAERAPQG